LYDRQMNSLLTNLMITRWVTAPWITPQNFHDWAVGSEFDVIRSQISQGRPALIGLWSMSGGPTSGHQVLAYGWDLAPNRLYVYDPNRPDEESILTPVSPQAGVTIVGTKTTNESTYRGYFFTDVYNWGEQPPYDPRYRDLVVEQGITVGTGNNPATVGGTVNITVTVANIGDATASFQSLFVWTRGPYGENLDGLMGGAEPGRRVLNPGERVQIVRQNSAFGSRPGRYTIGVSYFSNNGHWINIPALAGATSSRSFDLYRQRAVIVDQTFSVPESTRRDIDTGLTLVPGDEFAIEGSGQIWAGVAFTGLNGPEGWIKGLSL
jgi:hypothetical protein